MAEPNWELWGRLLQQIQAHTSEQKIEVSGVKQQLARVELKLEDLELGVNQAVGIAGRALARAGDADVNARSVLREVEDLKARVAALEAASA